MEKKKNPVVGVLLSPLPMLAAFCCQTVVSFVGAIVYVISKGIQAASMNGMDVEEIINDGSFIGVLTFIAEIAMLVCGLLWYFFVYGKKDKGPVKSMTISGFAFAVTCGIALQVVLSFLLNFVLSILPESVLDSYMSLTDMLLDTTTLYYIVTVVVLAPVAEELFFRGITLKLCENHFPTVVAIIVQAVWFGFMHTLGSFSAGTLVQAGYAFLLGLLFGFIAAKAHSVWPSIFLHIAVNGSAELMSMIESRMEKPEIMGYLMIPAGLICIALSILFYINYSKKLTKKQEGIYE